MSEILPLVDLSLSPTPMTYMQRVCVQISIKLWLNKGSVELIEGWVNKWLQSCDVLREIPEDTLPVKYARIPGKPPLREDNPLNAW